MLQRQLGILSVALLVIIFAFGCSNTDSPVSSDPAGLSVSAAVKAIPADAVVDSAAMYIHVMSTGSHTISVHNITSAWDEVTITWNSFGGAFDPDTLGIINFADTGWYALDVTDAE